ncbi:hypothetical protein LINPERPRIM_LOCUS24108 [Linum perenne]
MPTSHTTTPSATEILSASAAAESMWRMNNARVLSYIVGSVDPMIALSIRAFSSAAMVWTHPQSKVRSEIDMLSASMLSTTANFEIQAERQRVRAFQFLMRLRPEFEQVRSQLLSANKTVMNDIMAELERAETRLRT